MAARSVQRAGRAPGRAAPAVRVGRPAVGGPPRLRDLRSAGVRHDRVPRARELPPRARRASWRARSRTLSEVASARVHIAMAKDSLFVDQEQPAKASVVLRLKGNRPLAPTTVRGIAGPGLGSVESLRPESVTILDTYGRSLSRAGRRRHGRPAAGAVRAAAADRARPGDSVIDAARAGRRRGTRARERVGDSQRGPRPKRPKNASIPTSVVRSRQTSRKRRDVGRGAGGVAGARANLPPALSTSTAAMRRPRRTLATNARNAATAAPTATRRPRPRRWLHRVPG